MTERCLLFCCLVVYGRHKTEHEVIPPVQMELCEAKKQKLEQVTLQAKIGLKQVFKFDMQNGTMAK